MTTPGADQLNGQPGWTWRPVELYRRVKDSRQRATRRTGGPLPVGTAWDTVSTVDQITCLAEDLSVVYVDPNGKEWTLSDMVIELFKAAKGFGA